MPNLVLAENPYEFNPFYDNPRHYRRKGRRRHKRNPTHSRRRGGFNLNRLMSAQGATGALDIGHTAGIAAGFVGFQKVSEAVKQTGFMDAIVTIAASVVVGMMMGQNKFIDAASKGGIALGLLKVAMLLPGTSQLVSAGSMVLGSRPSVPQFNPNIAGMIPRTTGSGGKLTLAG